MSKDIACPSCHKRFRRTGDLNSHLRKSSRCKYILEERNAASPTPFEDLADPSDHEEDPPEIGEDVIYHAAMDLDNVDVFSDDASENDDSSHPLPNPTISTDRSRRACVEEAIDDEDEYFVGAYAESAGKVYGRSDDIYKKYQTFTANAAANPYYPFDSQLDWEFAKCVKESKIGDNCVTRLLSIPGVVEKLGLTYKDARSLNRVFDHKLPFPTGLGWYEQQVRLQGHPGKYKLHYRDIVECIENLYSDPTFANNMHYAPERHSTSADKSSRRYDGMHTGDWMWTTQAKLPVGSTVIPLIFATDKTQLSLFSGKETAYPLYVTIGNIDSDIRAQPSQRAWRLVGYLPTAKLDRLGLSEDAARLARARLFHYCMRLIVAPLVELGKSGKKMIGGDGDIRHCYPILACYVGDYPEQSLVCCTRQGSTCPKCPTTKTDFGDNSRRPNRKPTKTPRSIQRAAEQPNAARREQLWKEAGVVGVTQPFWADLPHADIHESITPQACM